MCLWTETLSYSVSCELSRIWAQKWTENKLVAYIKLALRTNIYISIFDSSKISDTNISADIILIFFFGINTEI